MDKLNEKLAKWAGCENKLMSYEKNFTQSLDACFKWLVPKLDWWTMWRTHGNPSCVTVGIEVNNHNHYSEEETPALALCLAIEKLIDETAQENTDYEWSKVRDKYGGEL